MQSALLTLRPWRGSAHQHTHKPNDSLKLKGIMYENSLVHCNEWFCFHIPPSPVDILCIRLKYMYKVVALYSSPECSLNNELSFSTFFGMTACEFLLSTVIWAVMNDLLCSEYLLSLGSMQPNLFAIHSVSLRATTAGCWSPPLLPMTLWDIFWAGLRHRVSYTIQIERGDESR